MPKARLHPRIRLQPLQRRFPLTRLLNCGSMAAKDHASGESHVRII
jgi:hypothetical protein